MIHTYVRTYAELEKTIGHFPTNFTILAKLLGQFSAMGKPLIVYNKVPEWPTNL